MISIIAAISNNGVIGIDNTLPWRLPADLKYFRETTMGHTIVTGRKNFEDIGKALPGRRNIILTRDNNFTSQGCEVAHSVDEIVRMVDGDEETFIIGGSEIYQLFLPLSQNLYITHIDANVSGNKFFPGYDNSEWKLVSESRSQLDEKNNLSFRFSVYQRIS